MKSAVRSIGRRRARHSEASASLVAGTRNGLHEGRENRTSLGLSRNMAEPSAQGPASSSGSPRASLASGRIREFLKMFFRRAREPRHLLPQPTAPVTVAPLVSTAPSIHSLGAQHSLEMHHCALSAGASRTQLDRLSKIVAEARNLRTPESRVRLAGYANDTGRSCEPAAPRAWRLSPKRLVFRQI
jgi:hypothetical protein